MKAIAGMQERFSIIKTSLLVLGIFIVFLPAIADDLGTNILSFPNIAAWKYRPDVAVVSANALISAGQNRACAALKKIAETNIDISSLGHINENICLLCRLVFISTNSSQSLRPPMLGDFGLEGHELSQSDWPDLPFVIVSNMPLSITDGYLLDGMEERGQDYLAYCEKNGTFRTQPFSMPSAMSISNALDQVFNSSGWQSIPWNSFRRIALTNLDWEQSSNIVENYVMNCLRQQAANVDKK